MWKGKNRHDSALHIYLIKQDAYIPELCLFVNLGFFLFGYLEFTEQKESPFFKACSNCKHSFFIASSFSSFLEFLELIFRGIMPDTSFSYRYKLRTEIRILWQ